MPGFGSWLAKLTELSGTALDPKAVEVLLRAFAELHDELRDQVTRKEFSQLLTVVDELVQAERETRQAVEDLASQQRNLLELAGQLAQAVSGLAKSQELLSAEVHALAEAQRRQAEAHEQLVLEVRALAEDQRQLREEQRQMRDELRALAEAQRRQVEAHEQLVLEVRALAEDQRQLREEQRQMREELHALAEAQRRQAEEHAKLAAEVRELAAEVRALAQAHRQTEATVRQLLLDMKHVKEELGGLSHSLGYGLENLAYRTLPKLLRERFGLEVVGRLHRCVLPLQPRPLEVNLWGLARRPDGSLVRVVGEAKTRLSAAKHFKGVEALLRKTRPQREAEEALVVLVTHIALPDVAPLAAEKGWLVVESWELEEVA